MMNASDAHRLLRGLVGSMREEHKEESVLPCFAVAISRDHGCGGEEIAQRVAAKLGVRCYDREVVDAVANQAHIDRYLMERLDEHVAPMMDEWIFGLVSGRGVANEDYRRHLARVLLSIWDRGGVIVGRGAHLFLASRRVWRVRLTGSLEICAQRLMKTEDVSHNEAVETIQRINSERAVFLRKQFNSEINDLTSFDMALNTDRIGVAEAAETIVFAMNCTGVTTPAAPSHT